MGFRGNPAVHVAQRRRRVTLSDALRGKRMAVEKGAATTGAVALSAAAAAAVVGAAVVRYERLLVAAALRLPRPTHHVRLAANVRVRVDPNVTLATDVYHPIGAGPGPTVLVRTPYGRRGWSGAMSRLLAQRFAERGYRVVLQDVRGRFDSEGDGFAPYVHERDDAAATADWIVAQAWSDGQIATWGSSYLGYVQWALAAAQGPYPNAMVPITTAANLGGPGKDGALGLDTLLRWVLTVDAMENREISFFARLARIMSARTQRRLLTPGFAHLPLSTVDEVVLARQSQVWRMWVENTDPERSRWDEVNHAPAVANSTAAVHAVTGWFDLFLDRQMDDYETMVAAGRRPFLTIGPWHHLDPRMHFEALRIGIDWFDTHLRGASGRLRAAPVRIWMSGVEQWRDLPAWPPPSDPRSFMLRSGGRLEEGGRLEAGGQLEPGMPARPVPDDPSESVTRYRYDPADPTPGIGGALLSTTAGTVDNRALEARNDVLTFTTQPLPRPLDVMGRPFARISITASEPHVDVVVRLCDVHPDGRSMNLSDGYQRLTPVTYQPDASGAVAVDLRMTPVAHRFLAGHRLRLQVSSGAHPRVARNLGTGEPLAHGTRMVPVDVAIHHSAAGLSRLLLPTV